MLEQQLAYRAGLSKHFSNVSPTSLVQTYFLQVPDTDYGVVVEILVLYIIHSPNEHGYIIYVLGPMSNERCRRLIRYMIIKNAAAESPLLDSWLEDISSSNIFVRTQQLHGANVESMIHFVFIKYESISNN
jgi:hypothetical protein